MKKVYYILIGAIFIFLLSGCGTNTPKAKTEEYLSRYTSLNTAVKDELDTTVSSSGLSTANQESYRKVLERQYKNIKYEVKDESVDADEAIVKVKITVYDLYKAEKNSLEYLNTNHDEFYENNILNQTKYDTYRLNSMLNITDTIDYDINFYLTKKNGTWTVDNPDAVTLEKIHGLYNYEQ